MAENVVWMEMEGCWRRGLFDMLCGDFTVEPHRYILWPTLLHPSEIHESPMAKRRPADLAAECQAPYGGTCSTPQQWACPMVPLLEISLWIFSLPTLPLGVSPWKVTGENQDLSVLML